MLKAAALIERFEQTDEWKQIWFSDEASLNSQNERIYREVLVKTDIPSDQLLVEGDRQQTSLMAYGAVPCGSLKGLLRAKRTPHHQEEKIKQFIKLFITPRCVPQCFVTSKK